MIGVIIKDGAKPWQIFQQENGVAYIQLSGIWKYENEETADVFVCVKKEDSGEPIIWWKPCICDGHLWSVELIVPVGGLYQIETCLVIPKKSLYDIDNCEIEKEKCWSEWAIRGDIIPHIGVGDLYVIAGQSNSVGWAKDYITDPCELGVHIFKNDRMWHLAQHPLQDSTNADFTANFDPGISGHSLYLSFAKYLKHDLNYPIGLIQTAKGGTCIDEWQKGNELYENMVEAIEKSGGKVKGVIWLQGGSDARKERYMDYHEKLVNMCESLRCQLNDKCLPIFIIQICKACNESSSELDRYYGCIREAQRKMGHYDNTYVIPSNDSSMSDYAHISAKFNMVLGERLAKTVLTHLYNKIYLCDAPNIKRIKRLNERTLELSFSNVYDKLELFICAPQRVEIAAEDSEGIVYVQNYEINKDKLLLTFEREIGCDAVVHGAYTKNICGIVPVDYATHIPMLSFYGIKIEN